MSGTHLECVKAIGDVCISLCVCHKEPERMLRVRNSYSRVQKSARVRCVFNQDPLAIYGKGQD